MCAFRDGEKCGHKIFRLFEFCVEARGLSADASTPCVRFINLIVTVYTGIPVINLVFTFIARCTCNIIRNKNKRNHRTNTFNVHRSIFEAKWNDDSRYFSRRATALLVSVSWRRLTDPAQLLPSITALQLIHSCYRSCIANNDNAIKIIDFSVFELKHHQRQASYEQINVTLISAAESNQRHIPRGSTQGGKSGSITAWSIDEWERSKRIGILLTHGVYSFVRGSPTGFSDEWRAATGFVIIVLTTMFLHVSAISRIPELRGRSWPYLSI